MFEQTPPPHFLPQSRVQKVGTYYWELTELTYLIYSKYSSFHKSYIIIYLVHAQMVSTRPLFRVKGLWDEVIMQYASLLRGYMQYAGALGRGYYAVC